MVRAGCAVTCVECFADCKSSDAAAIYRAMLAASPQGEGQWITWITHDGGPNPVPGKLVEGQYPGETRVFRWPSEGVVWSRGLIYRVTEGVKPLEAVEHDRIKRAIADGFSNGCEQYDEASEMQRLRYDMAAQAVFSSSSSAMSADHIGEADKMAHVLRGMVNRGTLIDAEAIDRALTLAVYRQDPDDDDRAWAASQAEVIGQPVVPVGSGELRERVAASIGSAWAHGTHGKPFDVKAETDAILDLIQSERGK